MIWLEPSGEIRIAMYKTPVDKARVMMSHLLDDGIKTGNKGCGWQLGSVE